MCSKTTFQSSREKSVRRSCYLAIAPISSFSFSPPQLIVLGHPVMCGAYTATIPPGSRLSMYRLLAGVYYAEGRCQGEGEGERWWGREVKDREEDRWRKYLDSSLICTTITPSELPRNGFRAVLICTGPFNVSRSLSSSLTTANPCTARNCFKKKPHN